MLLMARERQFCGDDAVVVGRYVFAHRHTQHLAAQRRVGLGDGHGLAGAPGKDGVQHRASHHALLRLAEAAAVMVGQAASAAWTEGLFEPAQIAGQLHQHHDQGRNISDSDCIRKGLRLRLGVTVSHILNLVTGKPHHKRGDAAPAIYSIDSARRRTTAQRLQCQHRGRT